MGEIYQSIFKTYYALAAKRYGRISGTLHLIKMTAIMFSLPFYFLIIHFIQRPYSFLGGITAVILLFVGVHKIVNKLFSQCLLPNYLIDEGLGIDRVKTALPAASILLLGFIFSMSAIYNIFLLSSK